MIRTQISFEKNLYQRAKRAARRRGVSLAELCRRGLREILGREAGSKPWMIHLGVLDSGDSRASETVDQVVYGREEP